MAFQPTRVGALRMLSDATGQITKNTQQLLRAELDMLSNEIARHFAVANEFGVEGLNVNNMPPLDVFTLKLQKIVEERIKILGAESQRSGQPAARASRSWASALTETERKRRRGENGGEAKTEARRKRRRGENGGEAKTEERRKRRRGENGGEAKTEASNERERKATDGLCQWA
ncbi:hypothetical protein niasHT_021211 [Heterodera trifolii]|uniref:Uncharacterized protein n=1 Tax=Heterodera trifolii TaxID=157864 RepID=A0ABD2JX03_9BILA